MNEEAKAMIHHLREALIDLMQEHEPEEPHAGDCHCAHCAGKHALSVTSGVGR